MQSQNNDIVVKVASVIAKQFNQDQASINPDILLQDVAQDSLDRIELIMRLEEEFNIEISDEDADALVSVNDVVSFVAAKKQSADHSL